VVFTPQILQNFRRGSADGLSITFLIIWLAGDVFNIVGAVLQRVLPTMVILAAYYTLADIVLLGQCLYYRRRQRQAGAVDGSHLSPATPLLLEEQDEEAAKDEDEELLRLLPPSPPTPAWKSACFNAFALLMVCAAGALGWLLTFSSPSGDASREPVEFSPLGQTFGYLCAVLYLASRIPQILLNARRRSCDGVSILFFIFACVGNATYVLSILANTGDGGGGGDYARYVAVNASWLLGSMGTLVLDVVIFAQFFVYGDGMDYDDEEDEEEGVIEA
jgi:uncharacterized protein with PQ loop repeat